MSRVRARLVAVALASSLSLAACVSPFTIAAVPLDDADVSDASASETGTLPEDSGFIDVRFLEDAPGSDGAVFREVDASDASTDDGASDASDADTG